MSGQTFTGRLLQRVAELEAQTDRLERERLRHLDLIAELRDDLYELASRVEHVHTDALRSLTHVLDGRIHDR